MISVICHLGGDNFNVMNFLGIISSVNVKIRAH